MSLSTELDPSKPYGGMTSLPEGHHGNFPERVHVEELFESEIGFVPPPILTKRQLLDQIGQELFDRDALWFLYDLRKYPCFQKFAWVSTLSAVLGTATIYYGRPSWPLPRVFKFGAALTAFTGLGSLAHCAWQHYTYYHHVQHIKSEVRTKLSYSMPERIQQKRDWELFQQAHPELEEQEKIRQEAIRDQLEKDRLQKKELHGVGIVKNFNNAI